MAPRIRIVYLIASLDVGGSERQLVALNAGLDNARYDKHIVCMLGYGPLEAEARAAGAELHCIGYPRPMPGIAGKIRKVAGTAAALVRLAALLRRLRPDIFHTLLPACNVSGAIASRFAGVRRLVCTRLSLGVYRDKHPILARLEDFTDPWFTLVHCKSRGIMEDVARREPVPPSKMRVVYNGIDAARFAGGDGARIRRELGIEDSAPVIGCVANLIPYKGHADIIDAAPAVLEACPAARFLFVGRDDGIRGELEARARKLGCAHAIVFAGARRDIPDLLAAMDIYLCASHEEGFSNVLLEAMSASLPVVATRVGGNPEAVGEGVTGRLVDARSPGQIAAALLPLIADPALRRRHGQAGLARVREMFSYEAMIAGMEAIYAEAEAMRANP